MTRLKRRPSLTPTHALMVVLGAVHALAFAPGPLPSWVLPYVQIFVLAAVFIRLFRASDNRTAVSYAFLFGISNFGLGLYWLFISMHKYGGLAWPLAALGVLALACFLAMFTVLATLLARRASIAPIDQDDLPGTTQLLTIAVWASAWTALEWLRGTLLTGFPWLNTGYAHIEGVLAPWAPVTGVYGLTWLAAFASAAIAMLIRTKKSSSDIRAVIGVGLALATGMAGIILGHIAWTQPHGDAMVVRLTQGAVPQSEKFDPELIYSGIQHYMQLAAVAPKSPDGKPDLIVLPETVVPLFQDQVGPELWDEWRRIAGLHDATILLGAPLRSPSRNHYTNSAIAFNADTPTEHLTSGQLAMRYDKHHLVPFGEFVPPGFRWFVDAMHIPLGDFDRGPLRQPLFHIQGQHIAPDICYEDVFGEEIIHSVRASDAHGPGANILINLSNLAWFGDSWAPRQHLQISRMRALETGRPMLRATNTGMTAAIAPNGMVRAVLQPMVPGILDVEVQGMQGYTPYVRSGNWPVIAWILLLLGLGLMHRKRFMSR